MKHLTRHSKARFGLFFAAALLLAKCSSPDAAVEVTDQRQLLPGPPVSETEPVSTPTPAENPVLEKLRTLLQSKGYEGIGLEFESESTLLLLTEVFSHPRANNRQLKAIYTGAQNSYDVRAQSLTVTKSTNAKEILAFIQKAVPLKRSK